MSGKLVTSGINDVATHSVHSEKIRLMKMLMIIIMNLSPETTVFGVRQNMTSAIKLRPEK